MEDPPIGAAPAGTKPEAPWVRHLAIGLGTIFFAFVNLFVVMPVAPPIVEQATGIVGAAALVTAVFSTATVTAEILSARLVATYPLRTLFPIALGLMGLPALVCVFTQAVPIVLGAMALRGLGFGLALVASSLLVARLAPAGRQGQALGYYGLATLVPSVMVPSAGLLLFATVGPAWVFAVAAGAALIGGTMYLALGRDVPASAARPAGVGRVLRSRGLLGPFISFGLLCFTYGGLITFGPVLLPGIGVGSASVFFLVFGSVRVVSRWVSGGMIDRFGARSVYIIAVMLTLAGLICLAARPSASAVVAAAVLYGIGFGAAHTATHAGMLRQVERADYGPVSALANLVIDGGVGLGALTLGAVAAGLGYQAVFWGMCALAAASLLSATPRFRRYGFLPRSMSD